MFNKKRIIVFIIFILLMFFLTTFAGAPAEIAKVQTRDVVFTDSYGNKDISVQKVEVGKDAVVPEDPHHKNYVFAGWYQFKQLLMYKTKVVEIDTFEPSSKTCSNCWNIKQNLTLQDRTYHCDVCWYVEDRDVNAAKNILAMALTWNF